MTSFNDDDEFVTAEQAAQVLRVTDRQARRYAASGQVRSKRAGARVLLHLGDVHRLADELRSFDRPPPPPQVVPQGELLQTIERLRVELQQASIREAALAERLRLLPAPEEAAELRESLAATRAERDALRGELERLRAPRPWYASAVLWLGIALALALIAVVALALLR